MRNADVGILYDPRRQREAEPAAVEALDVEQEQVDPVGHPISRLVPQVP